MSRHEGVSCDVCGKSNFRGKRFKCLLCYDYDLCCACYDNSNASGSHAIEHPVQCIITRADHEIFFGGDNVSYERAQSFTCPLCGQMGFSERRLQEHVVAEHDSVNKEVLCPLCAALPGWDPNTTTDSLVAHLALEHRSRQQQQQQQEPDDGSSYSSHFRRMLQARAAGSGGSAASEWPIAGSGRGGSSGGGGGGSGRGGGGRGGSHHHLPFSYASLRRSQPQAVSSSERRGTASSGPNLSGASPLHSPPSPTLPLSANMAALSQLSAATTQAAGGAGAGAGGSGGGMQLLQDSLSQDLVDFITQMSHGEPTSASSDGRLLAISSGGNQYVLVSGNGATDGAPQVVPASAADQRRLERSNARKYYSSTVAGGGGGGPAASSSRGASQAMTSTLHSQWECLMGTAAPPGEFILANSLDDVSACADDSADSEADREERRHQRSAFSQELVLSLLDVTLDSSLLEHVEQLSSGSEHES